MLVYGIIVLFMFNQFGYIWSTTIDSDKVLEVNEDSWKQKMMQLEHYMFPMPGDVFADVLARYIPVHSETELCRNHSQHLLASFRRGHLWALKMIDASSKIPPGLLDGYLQDLGHFKECINVEEPQGLFRGQHCFVETSGLPVPGGLLLRRWGGPLDVRPSFSLCVPSSCSVADVTAHVNHVLEPVHASVPPSDELFDYVTCSTSQHPPFRLKDYIAMFIFTTVVVIIIGSTLYDSTTTSVFSTASLKRHWNGLTDTRAPPGELSCLNGLRVIMIITVALEHRISTMFVLPTTSNKTLTDFISTFSMGLLELIPYKNVDGFFMISGTVLSYSFFRNRQKHQPLNLLYFYIKRYFRLTPLLAAVVLYTSTLQRYISEGPVWHRISNIEETVCSKYGWLTLLHIDNYMDFVVHCVSPHWYIACDFQFHLLSPLFLLPLYRSPRTGLTLLGVCGLASILAATVNAYFRQLYSGNVLDMCVTGRPSDMDFSVDYKGVHFRASGFLIGILLGYMLFNAVENNTRLTKQSLLVGWVSCVGTLAGLVWLTVVVVHPDHQWSPWLDPLYIGLSKPAYLACLAWLIATCALGHGGLINTFLSWSAFRPLSRLTFGVFLLHQEVQVYQGASIQENMVFSFTDVTFYFMGDLVLSYAVAALAYLFIEMPSSQIVAYILTDQKKGDSSQQMSELKLHRTTE